MTPPRDIRIGTVTIHAASARQARALADALPAALEKALRDSPRLPLAASAPVLDAGEITAPARDRALPALVAARIITAVTGGRGEP